MRTALWETSPGALAALLNARGPLEKADLWTLTLASGSVLRWSGHDLALTGGGNTWALGPGIKRTRVRFVVGVEVDTLTVTLTDILGTTIAGRPLLPAIRAGALVGAQVQLDRAFWAPGDTAPRGAISWFAGEVADVPKIDRYHAELRVVSGLQRLDVMVPRDVCQAGCLNTLYDTACGVSRAAFTSAGTAVSASYANRTTFNHSVSSPFSGYFSLGVITFTSGANAGVSRTVKVHAAGVLTVIQPWPYDIAIGDAFTVTPGCDKTQTGANGCAKFYTTGQVALHFRGMPYVPVPETVT